MIRVISIYDLIRSDLIIIHRRGIKTICLWLIQIDFNCLTPETGDCRNVHVNRSIHHHCVSHISEVNYIVIFFVYLFFALQKCIFQWSWIYNDRELLEIKTFNYCIPSVAIELKICVNCNRWKKEYISRNYSQSLFAIDGLYSRYFRRFHW